MLSHSEFRRRALELFQERSFSQVSMRELAAHVGISPGMENAQRRVITVAITEAVVQAVKALP